MFLYRLSKTAYAKDLKGIGAKLYGGRWNNEGTACIYTAASRALSLLEYSAHVTVDLIPKNLSFTTYKVPDDAVYATPIQKLPVDWKLWPHTKESRDFGTALLKKNEHLVIKLPSVIIPEEFIYVINPLHARMKEVKIVNVSKFVYDERIKG